MRRYSLIREPISESEIAQEAIREELSRILESPVFVQEIVDHERRTLEQFPLANDSQVSLPGSSCARLSVAQTLSTSAAFVILHAASAL